MGKKRGPRYQVTLWKFPINFVIIGRVVSSAQAALEKRKEIMEMEEIFRVQITRIPVQPAAKGPSRKKTLDGRASTHVFHVGTGQEEEKKTRKSRIRV
jgi:hypothetical protein